VCCHCLLLPLLLLLLLLLLSAVAILSALRFIGVEGRYATYEVTDII
jgi:uncharacterized membrane protein